MNPYINYIQQLDALFQSGKELPLGGFEPCAPKPVPPDAPKALLFSPHPDDECIIGLLPLRLMREAGLQIINVPVTFGSNVERQAGRAEELKNACNYLGFQCLEKKYVPQRSCFQPLEKTDVVEVLKTISPEIVFMPHSKDWNSRHIATHHLVMDALQEMPDDFSCTVIETEFWGAMDDPNLMVEADAQLLGDLIAALSFHVKEVQRNPYHISAPFWMQDNVRRGGELVGGQGGAAPDFSFATLYRLSKWSGGAMHKLRGPGRHLPAGESSKDLLSDFTGQGALFCEP